MILLALHGILTGRTSVTWPERLQAYAHKRHPGVAVLTDQYDAGPFPRLNWFFGNPRMARAMADRILAFRAEGDHAKVVLVGHSNGCDILRRVAIQLADNDVAVEALIMVSPPLRPSLDVLGLARPMAEGMLKRVVCYHSPNDAVLAPPTTRNPLTWAHATVRWPYGNAGRVGLQDCPTIQAFAPARPGAYNRIFPTYGHTTFFDAAHAALTFETIFSDARFPS